MALGFSRLPGKARNYHNPNTGETISRREHDKRVQQAGQRKRAPASRVFRQNKQQNQYNAMLESYVRNQRAQGNKITKKQARESDQFKRAVKMVRTKRKIGETDFQRQARQQARRMGLEMLGGEEFFRRAYDDMIARAMDESGEYDQAA